MTVFYEVNTLVRLPITSYKRIWPVVVIIQTFFTAHNYDMYANPCKKYTKHIKISSVCELLLCKMKVAIIRFYFNLLIESLLYSHVVDKGDDLARVVQTLIITDPRQCFADHVLQHSSNARDI